MQFEHHRIYKFLQMKYLKSQKGENYGFEQDSTKHFGTFTSHLYITQR